MSKKQLVEETLQWCDDNIQHLEGSSEDWVADIFKEFKEVLNKLEGEI